MKNLAQLGTDWTLIGPLVQGPTGSSVAWQGCLPTWGPSFLL